MDVTDRTGVLYKKCMEKGGMCADWKSGIA